MISKIIKETYETAFECKYGISIIDTEDRIIYEKRTIEEDIIYYYYDKINKTILYKTVNDCILKYDRTTTSDGNLLEKLIYNNEVISIQCYEKDTNNIKYIKYFYTDKSYERIYEYPDSNTIKIIDDEGYINYQYYNNDNKIIRDETTDCEGKLYSTTLYYYNKNGLLSEVIYYIFPNKILTNKSIYEYNDKNDLICVSIYDKNEQLHAVYRYTYIYL